MKKKDLVITAILVALLILAIVLTLRACAPEGNELDETEVPTETVEATEAIEPVTEPTEAATEAATEPEETEPEEVKPVATQPVTTSKPSSTISNSSSTGTNTGNVSNSSGTTTATPTVTEPATVENPNVVPAPAESAPSVTEAPTEPKPAEHTHNWQEVYHEAVTHTDVYYVCNCGARFPTLDAQTAHTESFYGNGEEAIKHFNYHTEGVEVVDTPAYSTWVCACGATSDTQP